MKQYTAFPFLLMSVCILLVNCTKSERDINLNLTEVQSLVTPTANKYIKLNPAANLTETFEWSQARAEDGGLVLYEVAFDQENGDFSKPFYTITSNNNGVENKLTLTHGQLNQIAALGGADFFQRKKFKWTVLASKGTNVKKATESRVLDLERPGGFATLPGSVYITGSATETGDDLSKALKMKQVSPGVFEIYTKLKAGTYKFVDATTGTPHVYYLYDNNGIPTIGVNGTSTFAGADKVERIRLNFNDINGSFAEVKKMSLWYAAGNTFWFDLPYIGNGVWRANGQTVNYTQMPWGFEERYKYRMIINDGTGDKDQWLNYATNDSPGQDGQYPHTVAYRTINLSTNNGSQWDWTWKFDRTYLPQGSVANFWVSLNASDPAYTINYEK